MQAVNLREAGEVTAADAELLEHLVLFLQKRLARCGFSLGVALPLVGQSCWSIWCSSCGSASRGAVFLLVLPSRLLVRVAGAPGALPAEAPRAVRHSLIK